MATDFGRGKGLRLQEIPFAEVAQIYEEQTKAKLQLSEKEFREVISAEYMVSVLDEGKTVENAASRM